MLNDQKILEELTKMPPPLKAELLHYMDYLMGKYARTPPPPKRPQFGSAKGFYKTTEDFDAPLEDFAEYM
ncbi:MAG: DUF2281 domain-containing protein [Candidatus Sericytochromatia bacterium]|nr:DUF2281 domain-containing protein [Candidatus Sericytochromatia bacterium]